MNAAARTMLLSKLSRLPLAMVGHTGTSVAIEQLAEVVRAILEGLWVEEETVADDSGIDHEAFREVVYKPGEGYVPSNLRHDGTYVVTSEAPQPDFAAMGGKFADDLSRAIAATPDLVMQPFVEQWLRDNLPKPPPDVEALIAAVRKAAAGGTVGWSDAVRAVAREMWPR